MPWTTPKTWTAVAVPVSDFNTHIRDNLNMLAFAGSSSWVPTLTGGGTTGNASLVGQYQRVGQLTLFHLELVWGGTTIAGTGLSTDTIGFTLPFAATTGTSRQGALGILFDDTTGNVIRAQTDIASGATSFIPYYTSGTGAAPGLLKNVTASQPWIWAQGDILRFTGMYLAA